MYLTGRCRLRCYNSVPQNHRVVLTIPALANMGSPGVYNIAQQLAVGDLFTQGSKQGLLVASITSSALYR